MPRLSFDVILFDIHWQAIEVNGCTRLFKKRIKYSTRIKFILNKYCS